MGFIRIKVLAEDNTIIAYKPILPLTPGTGFVGPESAMAAIGTPGALGYDCKAIARWDVVPFQVATDGFNVGVIAYHREGIEKVSFSLNDGPWVDVFEMSLNPTTNELEYCVSLSLSTIPADQIEVRARVIPNVGEPRILAGALAGNSATGEHSMFLAAVNTPRPEYFVSPTGSDSTGNGTRSSPYATIPHALTHGVGGGVGAEGGGAIVTLLPGDHHYNLPNSIPVTHAWLTIRSDYSEPSATTRFTSYASNSTLNKIHVKGMQFDQPAETQWTSYYGTGALWRDNCDFQGNWQAPISMFGGYSSWGCTDCTSSNTYTNIFSAIVTRNCHADGVCSDAFGWEKLLLSSSVRRLSRSLQENGIANDYHCDVWQGFLQGGTIENVIVRDLVATDQVEAQGIFLSGNTALFKDMMFLNCKIDNRWENAPGIDVPNYFVNVSIKEDCKHFLLYDSEVTGGVINDIPDGYPTLDDVVMKGNLDTARNTYFLPQFDGPGAQGAGAWPGTLPWTSPDTGIDYRP